MTTSPLLLSPSPQVLTKATHGTWRLPASKSLWARALLLEAITQQGHIKREALPLDIPEDIRALQEALVAYDQGATEINVGESGTAMRFMTAYLAATASRPLTLSGLGRQHQRPIAPLVTALRELGAHISYLEEEGYPPLQFTPGTHFGGLAHLDASSSSQYLSALLLLCPRMKVGYTIDTREEHIASYPYALMTLEQLRAYGYLWEEAPRGYFSYLGQREVTTPPPLYEADWSAASYAYALSSLLPIGSTIKLQGLSLPSLQGDATHLVHIFKLLGIDTEPTEGGIMITQRGKPTPSHEPLALHMNECPDLVPAVVVALVGKNIPFILTGVAHLRIKESDRLQALSDELAKLGVRLSLGKDSLVWDGTTPLVSDYTDSTLSPHGDHRIAMALSLLALRLPSLRMEHPEVVGKSFPNFWREVAPYISQESY